MKVHDGCSGPLARTPARGQLLDATAVNGLSAHSADITIAAERRRRTLR
jgi:hypothetical protein